MARTFTYPPKPQRGDAVAVLSPSWGGPGAFPLPFELGLARLRDEFGLRPVEYPTTRAAQASPAERAKDLHSAFGDPEIKAVLTSIGGEDEIKVLRHLDPEVLAANPKPFFGYSDNTNLHLFLWNLGLVSYQGGAVMVQFGRPGLDAPDHPPVDRASDVHPWQLRARATDRLTTMRKATGRTRPSSRPNRPASRLSPGHGMVPSR